MPKEGEYEDDGTWIWLSIASDSRLVISHFIGERSQESADKLVEKTAHCLKSLPLFVTDGLNFYKVSLLKQYGKLQTFPRTGKRGRPKLPKLIASELLRYAQVIKHRVEGILTKVKKKNIFGENIDPKMISTSYIERLNLTCRQDNNRISRKTIGFSKKKEELDHQMILYLANFNYCRKHRALKYKDVSGESKLNCPAKHANLIDHIWDLRELLTYPYYRIPTN